MPPLARGALRVGWLVLFPAAAFAHTGQLLRPHDLWTAWEFDPGVVIPLALTASLYWVGADPAYGIRRWESRCFWGGWWTLVLALVSPLHPLGEMLFSAHMVQHELIMLVAAPLMVLGRPLVPFLWALPMSWRRKLGAWGKARPVRRTWEACTRPGAAWGFNAAVLWIWHAPPLYQATLTSEWVHAVQHTSFLVASLLFWWALLRRRQGAGGRGAGVLYLFTTTLHSGVLGALLTFSPGLWYPAYATRSVLWGVAPLGDQMMAGLAMWVPAGVVYMTAALALLSAGLRESDLSAARWWPRLAAGEGKNS